jgi:hypothetical protein
MNLFQRILAKRVEDSGITRYFNRKGTLIYYIGDETSHLKKAIYSNNGKPLYMENYLGDRAYWKYKKSSTTFTKITIDGKCTILRFDSNDRLEYEVDHKGCEFWY